MKPHVYFLRPIGMKGPVKIGRSVDAEARLAKYSNLSPFPLEIAAKIEGDYDLEAKFHTLFVEHHGHHEWFHAAPAIDAVIDAILRGDFRADDLPTGKRLAYREDRWSPEVKLSFRLSHRIKLYERLGLSIPADVLDAKQRFGPGRLSSFYDPSNLYPPDCAATIEAFLVLPRPKAA